MNQILIAVSIQGANEEAREALSAIEPFRFNLHVVADSAAEVSALMEKANRFARDIAGREGK